MENKSSINVKEIYECTKTNSSISDIITKLNYSILHFIYCLLYREEDIDINTYVTPIFGLWCASIKKVEESNQNNELYNNSSNYLDDTSNTICDEISSMRTIAYTIGTHTETDSPYTTTTLVALVCAILKKLDINLIFN